jgi:cobalt-zinc-cadmium efflux system outer membrane protein
MVRIMRRFFVFVLCVVLGAAACAQELTPPPQLTLQDALRLAAESDPRLQGQTFARAGAEARRAAAALRPPVRLTADVENVLGTGRLTAFDDAEATLSLGTTLELGGKRAARTAVAERELDRLAVAQQAARIDILADVAARFIAVLRAQENLGVAREDRALAVRAQSIVAARVQSAAAAPVERSNAEVAAIKAAVAEQAAMAQQREAWARLVVAWGGAPESTGAARGDLFAAPPMPAFAGLQEMVERNPDILRLAQERRVREAELHLAEAQAAPDIDIAAGVRRLQAARAQAVVLSASVPLGSNARSRPATAQAQSRLKELDSDAASRRNELLGALFGLRQRAENARAALELLQTAALPAAQRAQEQAEAAFRAGRSSLLELTAAQAQLLDVRRAKIDAAADYHLLVIELERLVGAPLAAASSPAGAP